MKQFKVLFLFTFFLFSVGFQSCVKDECTATRRYIQRTPVYKKIDDMRIDIRVESPKELKHPGKIYFYNNYIFINEKREGIHIIDNSDASNPQNITFLAIEGNIDMAIKDNVLYADNYIDLLSISLEDISKPTFLKRVEEVFKPLNYNDNTEEYLVYYKEEVLEEEVSCQNNDMKNGGLVRFENDVMSSSSSSDGGSIGSAGSMARFSIVDEYLYVIDRSEIAIFDLDNITCPTLSNTVNVGWGIETLFPYQDKLFIGSQDGMYIFDNSDPKLPTLLSKFNHASACDPVVVKDDIAYVTLREGTFCMGFENQLDIVDISDLNNPELIKTYSMDHPHGLAVRDNHLFICDGESGLKVYDVEDSKDIEKIESIKDLNTYDVIALDNGVLLVIGDDGFYQYDASNPKKLILLSKIHIRS